MFNLPYVGEASIAGSRPSESRDQSQQKHQNQFQLKNIGYVYAASLGDCIDFIHMARPSQSSI